MKRSEMLKIIRDHIPSIDMDTIAQQEKDLNEGAEAILSAIEKAGMLPPYYEKWINIDGRKLLAPGEAEDFMKWEPEDEQQ